MLTTIEDKNKLKKQVLESLFELKEIQSPLTNDNIAADIINVVCKYIITNKNVTYKTSAEPTDSFLYNWDNCSPFVRDVVLSLRTELYGIISEQTSEALTQNIVVICSGAISLSSVAGNRASANRSQPLKQLSRFVLK